MSQVQGRRRSVALGILCLCALTAGVDMTITNLALPFIGRELDASTNQLQWTVDAYNIVLAGMLVLGGAVADRQGRRRVFLSSYALFGISSALAAFSPSIGVLIPARAVMGLAAAGVTAPALAIIASMYPAGERGRAIGAFVVFGATGLAVGPIVGGLLLDSFWWGSVFLVNVPVIAVGVVLGARTLPESRAPLPPRGRSRLDVVGALLSVVGLAGLLFGVIEGPGRGWTSPAVLWGIGVGLVALVAFVVRELRADSPLFDVRILRRPQVAIGSVTLLLAYLLFNSFLFLNPQFLQDVQGESIVSVGLLFAPFAVAFGLCSLQAQRVLTRLGARATITLGLVVSAVASGLFAVSVSGPVWATVAASVVLAVGLSVLIAPPSTVVMNALPPDRAGDGSSMNFVSRFVGASVGVAVVGTVLASLYARDVDAALRALEPGQAERARGSLQGALTVAEGLGPTASRTLTAAARGAFESGAAAGYVVVAVLASVAAACAWFTLDRERKHDGDPG